MSKTEFKVEIDETKVGGNVAEPCDESQEPEGEDDGSGSGNTGNIGGDDTSGSGSDDKTNRPGSGIGSTGPTRP